MDSFLVLICFFLLIILIFLCCSILRTVDYIHESLFDLEKLQKRIFKLTLKGKK